MRSISCLGALGVVLALSACSGGGAEEGSSEETVGGEEYEGAIASTDVEGGKGLFETHCGDCHPDGEEDVGPSLIAEPHTPGQLRRQIREGSGKMRPFSEGRLSNDDMEALLAYLASINAVK